MNKDMCVACDDGILNIRVGAIIMKDGKILMVGNDRDYLYSVGGRVKFGETEEAVVREVLEETGVQMEIDRLGFVHENYFYGDMPSNRNKLIYEISLFFYMKVPDAFAPISESFMEDNSKEHLVWASLDENIKMYPEFFKTELKDPTDTVSVPAFWSRRRGTKSNVLCLNSWFTSLYIKGTEKQPYMGVQLFQAFGLTFRLAVTNAEKGNDRGDVLKRQRVGIFCPQNTQ